MLQNLRAIIADLAGESENISLHAAEGYKWRIELMYRDLLVKECLDELFIAQSEVIVQSHAKSRPLTTPIGAIGEPLFFLSQTRKA